VGIIYGALVCMMQKDMKKLIAYSSVSHLGFCTLGIFALNPHGLSGSVIQQINHGISTGALFLLIGVLYERRHTRLISEFGGLSTPMPHFAAIYMIATLSSLGLPLLNGFIGEFTILSGVFQVSLRWAAWAVIGIVLGASYLLWLYQRVTFGPVTNPENEHLPDLNMREYATLIPLVLLAFWIGIYPKPLFTVLDAPVRQIVEQVIGLRDRLGFSVLFITHDVSLLIEMADTIAIMYAGRIVESAPARRLFRAPRHPYTAALLDSFPSLHGEPKVMAGISGSPPDMRNPPAGCAFHPRCRYALPRCAQQIPELTSPAIRSDRRRLVACWLHEERELPDELARPEPDGQPRTPLPVAPESSGGPR